MRIATNPNTCILFYFFFQITINSFRVRFNRKCSLFDYLLKRRHNTIFLPFSCCNVNQCPSFVSKTQLLCYSIICLLFHRHTFSITVWLMSDLCFKKRVGRKLLYTSVYLLWFSEYLGRGVTHWDRFRLISMSFEWKQADQSIQLN